MKKRFFYKFSGTIFLEAHNKSEAVKAVTGMYLNDYLLDERVYEVDEFYVPYDIIIRKDKFGTHFHPLDDGKKYDEFRKRECKYGSILNEFLHGRYNNKKELLKRMEEADENGYTLDDCPVYGEIKLVDFKSKKSRVIRLCSID